MFKIKEIIVYLWNFILVYTKKSFLKLYFWS